jgi:hypothetical protein
MAASPILPNSVTDPTGLDPLERRAMDDFRRRIKASVSAYIAMLDKIQFAEITVSRRLVINEKRYEFRTSPDELINLLAETGAYVDALMLQGGQGQLWFFEGYVKSAYQRGTGMAMGNIKVQSKDYAASRSSLESLLTSAPYQRRLGLLRAREFELMQGLSNDIKKDMAQILTEGLGRGLGPKEIAENLTKGTGIEINRANNIARTELPQAFKTARRDEARQAEAEFGFKILMLHLSAMSPTTRKTHAERNGGLYTIEEQQEWYGKDGNVFRCKCSEIEQLVDSNGKPLSTVAIDKARSRKLVYAGSDK